MKVLKFRAEEAKTIQTELENSQQDCQLCLLLFTFRLFSARDMHVLSNC